MVCPLPNDFLRWWFIAKSGNEIKVGFSDLFTQRVCVQETYFIADKDPFIEISKKTKVVKNFLYFARYPYAEVKRDAGKVTVIWRELAYSFLPGEHFIAKVTFDNEGKGIEFIRQIVKPGVGGPAEKAPGCPGAFSAGMPCHICNV